MSEQQMNDSTFSRLFILMILSMTVLTIVIVVLASFAAGDVNAKLDERSQQENSQAIAERIAPVGEFSAKTVAAPKESLKAVVLSAQQIYDSSCAACHVSGTLDAPIVGDAAAWSERLAKGINLLYNNAINGINNMPAKGGNGALSDDNVKAAVDYMLENSK